MNETNAAPAAEGRPSRRSEAPEPIDLREHGRDAEGAPTVLDRRLFMQLLVFTACTDVAPLVKVLEESDLPGVLYADVNDPYGVGLMLFHENPEHFVTVVRASIGRSAFDLLHPRPEMTMLGRTYSIGYEQDLKDVLLERPVRRVTNPDWPWSIWYPLRRAGAFEHLSAEAQRSVLMEHGAIGQAYGAADLGHDVRLSCHGLDQNDNDFVVGLVGPRLHPLSHIVQRMRRTQQTSRYLERLGPFFVGRAVYQRAPGQPARVHAELLRPEREG